MPRYIDADALKAKYEQMLPEIGDGYHKETLQDVLFELEYAPTVSPDEVRGVVHCEDCAIRNTATSKAYGDYWCEETTSFVSPDDFCSRGKKMEVNEDA